MDRPDGSSQSLWRRLCAFDFDGGSPGPFPFAARLARENGWSMARARQVVAEYRRFLFLAMVAGHPVIPSEAVDQAWHLHLVYTRSYWEGLCRDVLGRPLHHGPTRGGSEEGARFDRQYRDTLASYERLFAEPAPPEIWPSPSVRFGPDLRWRRVWHNQAWVVPKRTALIIVLGTAIIAALLLLPR